ncbi:MAG TPA: PaaI family thioesterase [Xanthobacteraceae bacterium]|nr:PaaI family thioesterase [Xanthobacteraceae bacterium]
MSAIESTSEAAALDWIRRTYATNPIATLLGADPLACDPVAGRITIAFEAKPEFCNLLGTVQGGMLAAMLDLVMSFSVLCTMGPGYVVPTIDMTTHFLSPAKPGRVVGEGTTVKKGRTVTFMEGRLVDAQGKLLTTGAASGTLMKWPPERKPG